MNTYVVRLSLLHSQGTTCVFERCKDIDRVIFNDQLAKSDELERALEALEEAITFLKNVDSIMRFNKEELLCRE